MFREITFGTTPICARLSENLNQINNPYVSRKVSSYVFRNQKIISEIEQSVNSGVMTVSTAEGLLKLLRQHIMLNVTRFSTMNISNDENQGDYKNEPFLGTSMSNILLTEIKVAVVKMKKEKNVK
jgi:hypothetical protein